jgi:hypothetical protein
MNRCECIQWGMVDMGLNILYPELRDKKISSKAKSAGCTSRSDIRGSVL